MGIFSGRHFPRDIILWAVRWYCRYGVSYRDLEEMMTKRVVPVDHTTILTAGSRNTPLSWISRLAGTGRFLTGRLSSWRVDETYIRVGGTWCYL